jgi:ribose transport system permease protein
MIVAILVIGVLFALANPTFGSVTNLSNVASQVTLVGVTAVSSAFVLIAWEIELCVGSIVVVCFVLLGDLLQGHVEIWTAFIITLLAGAAIGAFNGLLSLSIQVPTIIITLGTVTVCQGVADQISNGYPLPNLCTSTPFFTVLQSKLWGVIPFDTLVFFAFAVLSAIVLRRTTGGLRVYAMGSNRWSAEPAVIRLPRILVGLLTFNGTAAALWGIFDGR